MPPHIQLIPPSSILSKPTIHIKTEACFIKRGGRRLLFSEHFPMGIRPSSRLSHHAHHPGPAGPLCRQTTHATTPRPPRLPTLRLLDQYQARLPLAMSSQFTHPSPFVSPSPKSPLHSHAYSQTSAAPVASATGRDSPRHPSTKINDCFCYSRQ